MPISSFSSANSIMKPGVCTSTTRPASPYDGQVVYETDTDRVAVYDSSAWVYKTNAGAPALTLIKTQTIGTAVSSVTVTNAFNATYDNYFVTVSGGVGSTVSGGVLTLGATTTGYYFAGTYVSYPSATVNGYRVSNGAGWSDVINTSTNNVDGQFFLRNPYLAKNTIISYELAVSDTTYYALQAGGYLANTTSYTDFTITWTPGTATGGTIRVYGYSN